jgi:hypothetical protein
VVSALARRNGALLVAGLALLIGCASPVGVVRVNSKDAHRALTATVLTDGHLSGETRIVLEEEALARKLRDDPRAVLAHLHAAVVSGRRGASAVFALAELSFYHAQDTESPDWYLAAALYSWTFLFPDESGREPNRLDRRLRVAADLYNIAVAAAFTEDRHFSPRSRVFTLPFGEIVVQFDESTLRWRGRQLVDFVPVPELEVHGLRARYRQDGVGAPLAAGLRVPEPDHLKYDLVRREAKVPVTALLTFSRAVRSSHSVQGRPEAIEEMLRILQLHADAESAARRP